MALVQYSRVDVPTGKAPNLFSEEDYDDDGAEPFGKSDGVKSTFWVCNDPRYDYVIGLLLAKMTHGGLVALGTAWILVAWTHELSLEMKLSGLMPDLSRCLTVAAETTRVHVMMARFRVQDLRPGAVVARRPPRHRRDAFTPTVWSRRRSGRSRPSYGTARSGSPPRRRRGSRAARRSAS